MKIKSFGRSLMISGVAIAGSLSFFSAPLFAQKDFYKWKDASGTTHYSKDPPPKVKASTVRISDATGSEAKTASESAAVASTSNSDALRVANEDYRKRACAAARSDVAAAQSGAILVDGKDPEHSRSLTNEERAQASAAAQSRVDQFCSAEKSP